MIILKLDIYYFTYINYNLNSMYPLGSVQIHFYFYFGSIYKICFNNSWYLNPIKPQFLAQFCPLILGIYAQGYMWMC